MVIRAHALALLGLALCVSLRAPPCFAGSGAASAPADTPGAQAFDPPDPALMLPDGQPPVVAFRWAPLVGYDSRRERLTTRLALTSFGPVPRLPGQLDLQLEGAVGSVGRRFDAAVGARIGIPWLSAGAEYNLPDKEFAFAVSLLYPLRRGGLFHRGELPRLDNRPGKGAVQVGVSLPSPFLRYRITRRVQK